MQTKIFYQFYFMKNIYSINQILNWFTVRLQEAREILTVHRANLGLAWWNHFTSGHGSELVSIEYNIPRETLSSVAYSQKSNDHSLPVW